MNVHDNVYDNEAISRYTRDKNWIYFGGDIKKSPYDDVGTHHRYFCKRWKDFFDKQPIIPWDDRCVCKHKIFKNCYILNKETKEIQIIGSCCIKKFGLQGKTCSRCNKVHKNRSDNYCNDCRVIIQEEELIKNRLRLGLCACGRRKKYDWSKVCIRCWKQEQLAKK